MRKIYVYVRLKSDRYEWRTIEAVSLQDAVTKAEKMKDVWACLEASFVPGGVVT